MATTMDVAAALFDRLGPLTTIKLHKLVYYAQAWSLTWLNEAIFEERIEAWQNGPVVPVLWQKHRGAREVAGFGSGDAGNLTEDQQHVIAFVCSHYGHLEAHDLVLFVHEEDPWQDVYVPRENNEITHGAMVQYYRQLESLNSEKWVWLSGLYEQAEDSEREYADGDFDLVMDGDELVETLEQAS